MSPLVGRPALEGAHLTGRALLLLTALLLASAPVSQLLAGPSWLLLTLVAAAPVILGGVVLRGVLRPAMLVPLAQAGLIVVLMLVVETVLGLAPWQDGALAVLRAQAEIVPRGVNELASGMAPLVLGAPGTVLVVVLIALMTLLLDLMFLDLGWHTPTALLLMGALLIPALQQPSGGVWWQVAAPVLAGAMIFATRTVHADPRYLRGDRRPQAGPPAHPGRTLAAVALCAALVASLTPLLGSALPQLAPARIALNIDMLERWQDPDAPGLGPVMIDDDVSVRRSLLQQEDTEVLRYTTTAEQPSYLRLRTLNTFDGETYRGDAEGEQLVMGVAAFSDARDDGEPVRGSGDDFIDSDFRIQNLAGDRLPVPDNIRSVRAADRELDQAMTLQPSNGEVALDGVRTGLVGQVYSVGSEPFTSTAEELRAVDTGVFEQPFAVGYTSKDEVPESAAVLAEDIAADARAENAFDTAVAYQEYFRNSFAYSLTVNTAPGEDPLESFLADRIGYCEQFAAAFALMMTSQGYPARVVIGFTPGELDGEEWSVSAKNAHAWPEVWFGPEHGWVRFEPTPSAAANGVRAPGMTDRTGSAPEGATESPQEEDEPAEETATDEGTTEEDSTTDTSAAQASDGGGTGPSAATVDRIEWGLVSALGLGALLAAAAAATVILIRRRRIRAREARWAALLVEGAGGGGDGGDAGGTREGASGAAGSALAAERMRRRAGELAWSEITRELSTRETAIRWLGITGAWGRPPTRIALDAALPPARALEDLLAQIDAGEREVTEEHRAAAARIAEAFTAATYAAPLPEELPEEGADAGSDARGGDAGPHVRGSDAGADARGGDAGPDVRGSDAGADARGIDAGPDPKGTDAAASTRSGAGSLAVERPQHPLRRDSDQLVQLIRTAR